MKRSAPILCGLILLAAATRVALAVGSPRPFGYVWDLYHEGVLWTAAHGRLPVAADCGECYHPPLYFACGLPFYALGKAVSGGAAAGGLRFLCLLSMLCAGVVVYYCRRILLLLNRSPGFVLLGTALALVFPCLFIASYAAENDVLLAALMAAFLYRLCLWQFHPARSRPRDAIVLGVLAGLCALTKYSGLLAPLAAALVMAPRLLGPRRARAARDLALVAALAAAVCGWHYARNLRDQKKLFTGPPWAPNVFVLSAERFGRNWKSYDFHTLEVSAVVDLYRPGPDRTLDEFPVYRSVFSSLHAQAWTDMSFFSVPGRHGWRLPLHYGEGGGDIPMIIETPANAVRVPAYPAKRVRLWLVDLTLRLGLIPTLLALVGFAATLRRRALRPLAVLTAVSLAVYAVWFLAQESWGLKTKYILFLLPAYVAYAILGLRVAHRLDRRLGTAAAAGFIAALLAAEAYLWMFALG